ncbi:DUF3108 domain-containing protein [Ampullimonas aquatilis]|uniref:DUF3108 domain-containing protein n=1 Tax=Ampullimonas aquatilis TaxID=1341549 RepID=UPI003C71EC8B
MILSIRPIPRAFTFAMLIRRPRFWLVLLASLVLHLVVWQSSRLTVRPPPEPAPQAIAVSALIDTPTPPKPLELPKEVVRAPKIKPVQTARPTDNTAPAESSNPKPSTPPIAHDIAPSPPGPTETPPPMASSSATPGNLEEPGNGSLDDLIASTGGPSASPRDKAKESPPEKASVPASDAPTRFDPPPSAKLEYQIVGQSKGFNYNVTGTSDWRVDNQQFSFTTQASMLFLYSFEFKSVGRFDQYGLAPLRYTEKRGRRAEQATNFNRDRPDSPQTISFSSATQELPMVAGAQDRNSVLIQLAGLARGEPDKFSQSGAQQVYVAGTRDAEWWTFNILGLETIEVAGKPHQALHLNRKPRKEFDQTIDVWLGSDLEWYPIKIKFSEVNGDFLEQTLANIVKY